jgi:predicted metal-dependent hydrolase
MIHDVTIPFSFDTTPIEEQIAKIGEQEAKRVIREVVTEGIKSVMPMKYSYGYYTKDKTDEVDWRKYISDYMDEWMREHAEEVVDEAALLLVAKASRKKAWREVLAEVKAEGDGE